MAVLKPGQPRVSDSSAILHAWDHRLVVGRSRLALLVTTALLVMGCSAIRGRPALSTDLDAEIAGVSELHDASTIVSCLRLAVPSQQNCRDSIVQARLIAMDARYTQFRQAFYGEARWGSFAATVASLGLTSAASLTPVGTAHILGAAATGVTGTKAAYDRQVLTDRTANAIENSMDAGRGLVAVRIRQGLQRSPEDYPLAAALSDLEDYYNAGTLLGALANIGQTAGAQAQAVNQELKTISGFVQSSAADFLRNYINPPGATDAVRRQRMDDVDNAEKRLGVKYQLPSILATGGDPAQAAAVARALGWRGQ
jgi:hypothetical protein